MRLRLQHLRRFGRIATGGLLICLLVAPACLANHTGFVHRGTQPEQRALLLDGDGEPIRLNGFNLGGWLDWEGWL